MSNWPELDPRAAADTVRAVNEKVERIMVQGTAAAIEIARLRAELARERERGAWRPIETLPRDGRRVVVVDDTGLPWVTTADVYVTRLFAVTHWMPLPPAPERQEVG